MRDLNEIVAAATPKRLPPMKREGSVYTPKVSVAAVVARLRFPSRPKKRPAKKPRRSFFSLGSSECAARDAGSQNSFKLDSEGIKEGCCGG